MLDKVISVKHFTMGKWGLLISTCLNDIWCMLGENHLIAIGIDPYTSSYFPNLNGAKRDAETFAAILTDKYGFSLVGALYNEKATRSAMFQVLRDLGKSVQPDDNVVIYFAGHGYFDHDIHVGYLVPYDSDAYPETMLPNSHLIDVMKGIKVKHVLLIADSCFSGSLIEQSRSGNSLQHDELEKRNSRWIITSGALETVGDGKDGEGSLFTQTLCEILTANELPTLSAGEVFSSVQERMQYSSKQQRPKRGIVICPANKGGDMIFRTKTSHSIISVAEENPEEIIKPEFKIPTDTVKGYISRSVTKYDHTLPSYEPFGRSETGTGYLKDVIVNDKRVVLLGSAGSGKSIELQQLALSIQNDTSSPFVAIYKRFNTYTQESIDEYLPSGWSKVPEAAAVVFLDGLDEIQPSSFHFALRKILSFSENYPQLRMIISCRTNFYDLPSPAAPKGLLEGFSVYLINDISPGEIKRYADEKRQTSGEAFLRAAFDENLWDLIQKPFFLQILLDRFKSTGNLQGGRDKIMEGALLEYYHANKAHYLLTKPSGSQHLIFSKLERIAFVMEMMGRNYIENEELHQLFPKEQDYEDCKSLPAFKKDPDHNRWMFEHNNLQEYLAARILSRQDEESLIEVISLSLGSEKRVKPTWVNTLSFLMSMQEEHGNLIEWIIKHDREVLIRFEPDRVSDELRKKIFKDIFNYYSDKGIWLSSNKFSDKDLARFGAFAELIDFLIDTLTDKGLNRVARLNAVHVLGDYDYSPFPEKKKRVTDALATMIEEDFSANDIHTIIGNLANVGDVDPAIVYHIISKYRRHKNEYLRAALYRLLHRTGSGGKYIDVLLEGIHPSQIQDPVEDREGVNLMDEDFHLQQAIESITEPEALKKLIAAFSSMQVEGNFYTSDKKESIEAIIQNAVIAHQSDTSVYEVMFDYLIIVSGQLQHDIGKKLVRFFEATDTRERTFFSIWENKNLKPHDKGEAISFLIDQKIIDRFIELYNADKFSDTDLLDLRLLLHYNWTNNPTAASWVADLEKVGKVKGVIFTEPARPDYEKLNKLKTQKSFDVLFDKTEFTAEIIKIFSAVGRDEIRSEDLLKLRRDERSSDAAMFVRSALRLIDDFLHSANWVSLDTIVQWIAESEQFENWRVEQLYQYLSGSLAKYIDINDDQRKFIEDRAHNQKMQKRFLWFFLHHFHFSLSKEQLLELTQYHDFNAHAKFEEPGSIEMLAPLIDDQAALNKRVEENLHRTDLRSFIWVSNAAYALRQNLRKVYLIIVEHLQQAKEREYQFYDLLKFWFDKSKDYARMKIFIQEAASEDIRDQAISLLIDSGKERDFIIQHLLTLLHAKGASAEERIYAARLLMKVGNIEGFHWIATHILQQKDPSTDFSQLLNYASNVKELGSLNAWMQLLYLAKQPAFQTDKFNSLESSVSAALFSIGSASSENFAAVAAAVRKFVSLHPEVPDLNFMEFLLQRIEQQINTEHSKQYTLKDAVAAYQTFEQ